MHQAEIAASPDPEQVVSLLYAIAEVYEEHLLDDNKAIDPMAYIKAGAELTPLL